MTLRVHVHGAHGRMGSTCIEAIQAADDLELCGATGRGDDFAAALAASKPDVVVEFTIPDAVAANLRVALSAGIPVVSGTTGLPAATAAELGQLATTQGVAVLLAPNFAIGVLLMQRFAAQAVAHFTDLEILEFHHDRKVDAPSGTALHTAERIADAATAPLNHGRPEETESVPCARGGKHRDIPIHSVRLPGLLAHQEVVFGGLGQVLTIRHDALDRRAFMPGVLLAVRKIRAHTGLLDSLERLL